MGRYENSSNVNNYYTSKYVHLHKYIYSTPNHLTRHYLGLVEVPYGSTFGSCSLNFIDGTTTDMVSFV